jgi:signal peptidase I
MSKSKKYTPPKIVPAKTAAPPPAPAPQSHAIRETIESIVIAFVLAFLFRTFEAEAFVIPTGSMAPTLMGRHKDVDCPKCGYRYQVNASEEETGELGRPDIVGGMCPVCRYVMPMRPDLQVEVPGTRLVDIPRQRSYNGDRILVNKYVYTYSDPQRWDVIVFKFPGDAKVNYIKRLVGLPGETLRLFQGDLYRHGKDSAAGEFAIAAKPADKVLAMRQLVHDTEHDPVELHKANWPLRWASHDKKWKSESDDKQGLTVAQRYSVDSTGEGAAWLNYQHIVPDFDVWKQVAEASADSRRLDFENAPAASMRPQLITDSNPYDARTDRNRANATGGLDIDPSRQGLHWVGDLMVEADVDVESDSGKLLLQLVEGGRKFTCTIDLSTGKATLGATTAREFAPTAQTSVKGPGNYRLGFANFDDRLFLWVDGDEVAFDGVTPDDWQKVFSNGQPLTPAASAASDNPDQWKDDFRQGRELIPVSTPEDAGDLAPVRIGAEGAKLTVTRLQVWRDVYYIAVKWGSGSSASSISDYSSEIPTAPKDWTKDSFPRRDVVEFTLNDEQLFVMGDNSAESSDARLWATGTREGGRPGGHYLEKRLLIGKALCVYWPHSWNRIPGTPIPFPLFPNFADMRLVR